MKKEFLKNIIKKEKQNKELKVGEQEKTQRKLQKWRKLAVICGSIVIVLGATCEWEEQVVWKGRVRETKFGKRSGKREREKYKKSRNHYQS